MTDASWTDIPSRAAPRREAAARLPAPQPFGAPVLIGDVATPLAGETVLGLLMKRMAGLPDEDGPDDGDG